MSVDTVSVFPYTFDVPSPYDETNIVIKIIDSESCVDGQVIPISPTPTSSVTPTMTPTSTQTPTNTQTPTQTQTQTITNTQTPTTTTTNTPTPTSTPVVAIHYIGQNSFTTSGEVCNDIVTILPYYTYLSESNDVPVVGAVVYQTLLNGVLYNPFNGGNKYYKMTFGVNYYVVQINGDGEIISYEVCSQFVTLTPTPTLTQTQTPTNTETPTQTPTNTLTPTQTPTNTDTPTQTPTNTETPTQTPTNTTTPTNTVTSTTTQTQTPTNTLTPTPTNYPSCPSNCYTAEVYISPIDLLSASGNTNPGDNNIIQMVYYDCSGLYSTINFTTSGYQYQPLLCITGSTQLINFNYYQDDVQVFTNLSTLNRSYYCCGSVPPSPTPTLTPTMTPTNTDTPTQTPTNTATVTPSRALPSNVGVGQSPYALTEDSLGNVYVGNINSDDISKITPSGVSTIFKSGITSHVLAMDSLDNLYVLDAGGTGNFYKVEPNGVTTIVGTFPASQTNLKSLILDGLGNFYTCYDEYVVKIDNLGVLTTFANVSGVSMGPATLSTMVMDSEGNLFAVNDYAFYPSVFKITTGGTPSLFATFTGAASDIAIDSSNNLYINSNTAGIVKITPLGVVSYIGTLTNKGEGIALDPEGNIYTTNTSTQKIYKTTQLGVSTIFGSTQIAPFELLYSNSGRVYVANWGSDTVTIV